jgi:pyruvate kinase
MVARGDLGIELPFFELPILQKRLIKKSSAMGKIDITATQMLASMCENPIPTRAEVSDVANAIFDGTDVIMMSNETATGKYPVESVRVMSAIARNADLHAEEFSKLPAHVDDFDYFNEKVGESTALAAAIIAKKHNAIKYIVCCTHSGHTAVILSQYRPRQPIIALTANIQTYNRLAMAWGVYPYLMDIIEDTSQLEYHVLKTLKDKGLVELNDFIVLIMGSGKSGVRTANNTIRLIKIKQDE